MSKDGIYSDIDMNVMVKPTNEGLAVVVPCGICQRQLQIRHTWNELAQMLNNQPVPGVTPGAGGWVVAMRCVETCRDGMGNQNLVRYKLRRSEVQGYYQDEMSRRGGR